MSDPKPLSQWKETVSMAFPSLSRPQATVLALWSYGMVIAKSCGITSVCAALARASGRLRRHFDPTLTRMVLRCQRPERSQPPILRGDDVFCPFVGVGAEVVACR